MALISHNRHEIATRTDYDDGSPDNLAKEIQDALNEPNQEAAQEIGSILLTHSTHQV